jgi:hypothetical protein
MNKMGDIIKLEEHMLKITEFLNKNNDEISEISDDIRKKSAYIDTYKRHLIERLQTAIKNTTKLNEEKWNKISSVYYEDFFQVRTKDTNTLDFTYSFSRNNGLSKRDYNARHINDLTLKDLQEFLDNEKAVKKLIEIIKYDDLIQTLKDICSDIKFNEFEEKGEYKIKLKLNPIEEKLVDKNICSYDLRSEAFGVEGIMDSYQFSYKDNKLEIIKKIILFNHTKDIRNEAKILMAGLNKQYKLYKAQEDIINQRLAKWLMLEMI